MSQTKMFYILPLSLKVCSISASSVVNKKQLTKILKSRESHEVSQVVFFPWLVHLSFYRYISLYCNLTETVLNIVSIVLNIVLKQLGKVEGHA